MLSAPAPRTARILAGLFAVLSAVLSAGLVGTVPIEAQSGVSLGTDENILHLYDDSGRLAVDFNVDGVNTPQSIEIGRADLLGELESDIDVVLNDSNSTLGTYDRSIQLDASAADIILGSGSITEPGSPGTLTIRDGTGFLATQIEGSTGNIVQIVDNTGTVATDFDSNGAVKAWAIIDIDGSVVRCWNCNTSAGQTRRLSDGNYEVDFLSFTFGDLNNRPVLGTTTCPTAEDGGGLQCQQIGTYLSIAPRLNDASSFFVRTWRPDEDAPGREDTDSAFTIVVF